MVLLRAPTHRLAASEAGSLDVGFQRQFVALPAPSNAATSNRRIAE